MRRFPPARRGPARFRRLLRGVGLDSGGASRGALGRIAERALRTDVSRVVAGPKTWTLHVGESFGDVPRSQLFYRKIETIFHNGITVGCTSTDYCPSEKVPRSQMAIFIARGIAGGGTHVPVSGTLNGRPYDCETGGVSLFTDVAPTDTFCKSVHYIAVKNVTTGCAPSLYCSAEPVRRAAMAIFMAKAVVAPAGGPGVPTYGPIRSPRCPTPATPRAPRSTSQTSQSPIPSASTSTTSGPKASSRAARPTSSAPREKSPATRWRNSSATRST